jgi:hypothetical protein
LRAEWEPSTESVRAVIRRFLEVSDFPGRERLLEQVEGVEYVAGPATMVELRVDRAYPAATEVPNPAPSNPAVVGVGGEPIGTLVLWLDDGGYMDCLEFGWVTDEMPTTLPKPERILPV